MRKSDDSGKFLLENQLRTWSDLRRERQAAIAAAKTILPKPDGGQISEKDKEKEMKLLGSSPATGTSSPIPTRKRWGGCPDGCDHGKHYFKKENSMHAMKLNGKMISASPSPPDSIASRRPATRRMQSSSDEDEDDPRGQTPAELDVQRSLDEVISSPDGTPSFISVEDRLRNSLKSPQEFLHVRHCLGRDGGGSASGANSDTDLSADEDARQRLVRGRNEDGNANGNGNGMSGLGQRRLLRDDSRMGKGAKANALGDQSDAGSDGEDGVPSDSGGEVSPELLELEMAEKMDKSIKGSVY